MINKAAQGGIMFTLKKNEIKRFYDETFLIEKAKKKLVFTPYQFQKS